MKYHWDVFINFACVKMSWEISRYSEINEINEWEIFFV